MLVPDPWFTEFAHARTSWRDDGRREDVPRKDHEGPSFGIGSRVVFSGSDPGTRREWTVEDFDRPLPPPGVYTAWRLGGDTTPTCTIRRGSAVKTGVSITRLELAPENDN
jgi:hypothetical protein